jgi:stage II sporulation protein AB (anti-sigma F factor)
MNSEVTITMESKSENESFARVAIAAFIAPLNPTLEEINDIKTAVSEAVTNAIIHGYSDDNGKITLTCKIIDREIIIEIKEYGFGIENIKEAMKPLYTSKPEMERSGIGFTVMKTFMDDIFVDSKKNYGTTVVMKKKLIAS